MSQTPIRRAQLIAPFGVGSLYTGSDGVAMIAAGLDHWYRRDDGSYRDTDREEFEVQEWRLQRILGVGKFRLPPDYREPFGYSPDKTNFRLTVPFLRFPRWHFCPKRTCRALVEVPQTALGRQWCSACDERADSRSRTSWKGRSKLVQVPFIAICSAGHCQDFPWREWVHRSPTREVHGRLRLRATGGASLAAQRVECDCGVEPRTLAAITQASSENGNETTVLSNTLAKGQTFLCRGQRPWLGDLVGEGCDRPLRGSLRSAINVYYAHVESSIFIPRSGTKLNPKLEEILTQPPLSTWIKIVLDLGVVPTVSKIRESKDGNLLATFDDNEIIEGLDVVSATTVAAESVVDDQVPDDELTQQLIRRPEFKKLRDDLDTHELSVRRINVEDYGSPINGPITRVNLVATLRETRALFGFSRVVPATLRYRDHRKRLWLDEPQSFNHNWLPAYVVNGEGFYLELDERRISAWEDRYAHRLATLQHNDDRTRERREQPLREIPGRYVLIHTFAHLLINRLIFEAGYSSASLRERLYVAAGSDPMAGVLIYTAAGDSEGTMGGLVRMGKPGVLESVVSTALAEARWCSADPVCMELGESGQGPESCNLAACHSCGLLPETACENFNRFLDRAAVVGSHHDPSIGFFSATDLAG